MPVRVLVVLLVLSSLSFADIIDDVRIALSQNNSSAAASELNNYRAQHGADPEYLEALSWMARGALAANQLDQADQDARQTESLVRERLHVQSLDTNPHFSAALGAALEVEAQVLVAHGQDAAAIALLRRNLVAYGKTSIRARLQKNLNLLALAGQPAPSLITTEYLGPRPVSLLQMKGTPVLLFFWAHWCGDCKYEGPIIAQLSSEFAAQGLKVEAPTQLYGYAAQGEDAAPTDELAYIERVWQHYYPGLQGVPVPVSSANFDRYGASTTPTLVLIDRKGRISLYHPGLMQYDELRAAIRKAM